MSDKQSPNKGRVAVFMDAYDPDGSRHLAFKAAYESLINQTVPPCGIYVVGSGGKESDCADWPGVVYSEYSNRPLSNKRQFVMNEALKSGAPYLLCAGSDDLFHPNYIEAALQAIKGKHWTGVHSWFFVHSQKGILWITKARYSARKDPIGTGRLYSANFIKKNCKTMWEPGLNRSLDGSNSKCLLAAGALYHPNDGIICLVKGDWPQITPLRAMTGKTKWRGFITEDEGELEAQELWPGHYSSVSKVLVKPGGGFRHGGKIRACFITPMSVPAEVKEEPWGMTGQWCWAKAYNTDFLDPRLVSKQWGILNEYDLIFVPGFIRNLQWMRELWRHRPGGKIISWLDYGSELIWRLPAVQYDPMLPAEIWQADVIICPDRGHLAYLQGTEAVVVEMVHPVDGEALRESFKGESSPHNDCIWVFHQWAPDLWAQAVPVLKAYPQFRHIAVGLTPETITYAGMHFDVATTILPRKELLQRLSAAALCVDMNPFSSMGRVVLEAASLKTPVMINRKPTCNVEAGFWYEGLGTKLGPSQAEQVKQHWIEPSKEMLEKALK